MEREVGREVERQSETDRETEGRHAASGQMLASIHFHGIGARVAEATPPPPPNYPPSALALSVSFCLSQSHSQPLLFPTRSRGGGRRPYFAPSVGVCFGPAPFAVSSPASTRRFGRASARIRRHAAAAPPRAPDPRPPPPLLDPRRLQARRVGRAGTAAVRGAAAAARACMCAYARRVQPSRRLTASPRAAARRSAASCVFEI